MLRRIYFMRRVTLDKRENHHQSGIDVALDFLDVLEFCLLIENTFWKEGVSFNVYTEIKKWRENISQMEGNPYSYFYFFLFYNYGRKIYFCRS